MARAFLEQSRLSGCSFLLVRSAEALSKISELARDTYHDVQDPAVQTLQALSESQSNLKRLSMQSTVLDTLVETVHCCVDQENEGRRSVCRNAVLAILNLTNNRCARKRAARHAGVVASLSRYGTSDDVDDELRTAALHGVILLSPLM